MSGSGWYFMSGRGGRVIVYITERVRVSVMSGKGGVVTISVRERGRLTKRQLFYTTDV